MNHSCLLGFDQNTMPKYRPCFKSRVTYATFIIIHHNTSHVASNIDKITQFYFFTSYVIYTLSN